MQKAAGAMNEMLALEELASGDTIIHRFHPLSKLIVTLVYLVAVISVNRLDFLTLSPFFFYPAILLALSEIPVRTVAKRVSIAIPFVLLTGISNLILEPAAYFSVFGITVSMGIVSFAVLMEKAVLTVGAVCILMATTKTALLFSSLRNLGMPKILAATLLLCLRYLSLLTGEADRMIKAYHLRSVKPKGIRMGDMGSFAGQLLLRSINKAEHVFKAMKLRGFDGTFAIADIRRMDAKSACYAAFAGALILLCRFLPVENLFGLVH